MGQKLQSLFVIAFIVIATVVLFWGHKLNTYLLDWSEQELAIIESLWIESLPPKPLQPSNGVADNVSAAKFGHLLFFDTRFSGNGAVSCASCHQPEKFFTDGLQFAQGVQIGIRHTMGLPGLAYSPWFFWDGRKDSLWSQALSPLENTLEHASSRIKVAKLISKDKQYRTLYEHLFGPLPDISNEKRFPSTADAIAQNKEWQLMTHDDQNTITTIFVNIAKSLAAYQRLLVHGPSRFDMFVEELQTVNRGDQPYALTLDEQNGLRLFIGKAQCINCHNGPLFTNHEFHNTGLLSAKGMLPSQGRVAGVRMTTEDFFNCLGKYSDATEDECFELRFAKFGDELMGSHKVPSLRNAADTAPYMHAGQIGSLEEVIAHYNQAPLAMIGHNETKPLNLNKFEQLQLLKFLASLSGPLQTEQKWLTQPELAFYP